jgi:predicted transcriptional regulator
MTTRVITAHVPVDLAEKVDAFAERLDRPRGWVMKQALAAWIDREEERDRLTREGLAAVDAGDHVSDELVSRWIDDLEAGRPTKPPL